MSKERKNKPSNGSTNGAENKPRIVLKVERERLTKLVTIDEWLGGDEGDLRMLTSFASKLVWNETKGEYYDISEGRRLLGPLSIDDLMEVIKAAKREVTDLAVPPPLEDVSE